VKLVNEAACAIQTTKDTHNNVSNDTKLLMLKWYYNDKIFPFDFLGALHTF